MLNVTTLNNFMKMLCFLIKVENKLQTGTGRCKLKNAQEFK